MASFKLPSKRNKVRKGENGRRGKLMTWRVQVSCGDDKTAETKPIRNN